VVSVVLSITKKKLKTNNVGSFYFSKIGSKQLCEIKLLYLKIKFIDIFISILSESIRALSIYSIYNASGKINRLE
jgi:hypothetical protein